MLAVLYLNNSWEWSGGYGQYLQWAGYGKAPAPAVDGYAAYMNFVAQFVCSDSAQALYDNYVRCNYPYQPLYEGTLHRRSYHHARWQIGMSLVAFCLRIRMFC